MATAPERAAAIVAHDAALQAYIKSSNDPNLTEEGLRVAKSEMQKANEEFDKVFHVKKENSND